MIFETWFLLAVLAAVATGFSSFYNKIAAHHNLNIELIVIYSSLFSSFILLPLTIFLSGWNTLNWVIVFFGLLSGSMAALSVVYKVKTLKCIDAAIFFPLFKTLSPIIAITAGVLLFSENFTAREWTGLCISLSVPLLLISRIENGRQKNLARGLVLIVVTSLISALVIIIHKYSTLFSTETLWLISSVNIGVLLGSVMLFTVKNRSQSLVQIKKDTSRRLVRDSLIRGLMSTLAFTATMFAFALGGTLGIVYTIISLYILIPIVLSIIIYKEHCNTRKIIAIILSVVALGFFG